MNPLWRGGATALLIVMGTMWGLQFAMLKMTTGSGYSEPVILMIALGSLSVIYALMSLPTWRAAPFRWEVVRFLGIASVLGYVIPILSVLHAAPALPTGLISMFACASTVVAILLAALLKTERVSRGRMIAVLLGITSVAMVVLPELALPDRGDAVWMLVALIVPVVFGIESIFLAACWPKGLSALHAVTGETFIAALLVSPIVLLSDVSLPAALEWGRAETAILIFVLAGVVESLIYFVLIKRTGGVFVNFAAFVSLFAGIGWGMVLFGESHGPRVWFAVAILAGALVLASREKPAT